MIRYFNRRTKNYNIEKVAGDAYLKWIYSSPLGMKFLEIIVKKKIFSKLYGLFCSTKYSKRKIRSFIDDFNIDMSECAMDYNDFNCFNDFFSRSLKKNARPINMNKKILISPVDGRLTAYEHINLNKIVQIKGFTYSLCDLINNNKTPVKFNNGTCLIFRLCPTDYHRFHFIDWGKCESYKKIKGDYYSVNPISLENISNVFCKNKREWSIFHSNNFGDVIYVEIGATCVGSIIQTYCPKKDISKGAEKGYFKFGGSTVILFFEKNKITVDKDIIEQTKKGYETRVLMGEKIGIQYEN
ncbi:phosphatidylserine decarboxylase [Clostridium sp. HV4-5-A1G]|uniref:phosphatidylserine decarboxylase n=1 Tax=Clostridium sp. HV4-5-A1G TaxID=2004595 RepID=UPI00123C7687|nr:phosphatidylserine decarboxylase [Clostridium sp. HV4-5-A1G]KAA8664204.1 phosphatidylserine decarboxylase [Clostridium sp. HV4-5-A1G]